MGMEKVWTTTKTFVENNSVECGNDEIGSEKHLVDYSYVRNNMPVF